MTHNTAGCPGAVGGHRRWPQTQNRYSIARRWTLALLAGGMTIAGLRAELSEPDNVLYGTVVIDSDLVTAARTDVIVEARRAPGGPVVASYRMGSDPRFGDYYALRIGVEAFGPTASTNNSLPGQALEIVVRDEAGIRGQGMFTVTERGQVQQVNFGTLGPDSDGNGLPDAWELSRFGRIGQEPGADSDLDGLSNEAEWIAGTHPLDGNDSFKLTVSAAGGNREVSFVALRAEGPGYEGRTRIYTLLASPGVGGGVWTNVPSAADLVGDNSTVVVPVAGDGPRGFFRGQVRLEGGE